MPFWTKQKVKDPVCGMELDPKKATITQEYQGTTYYYCSPACQANFTKEPAKYTAEGPRKAP